MIDITTLKKGDKVYKHFSNGDVQGYIVWKEISAEGYVWLDHDDSEHYDDKVGVDKQHLYSYQKESK